MSEELLGKEKQKIYKLITDTFSKGLRRGIRTKGQIAKFKSLQAQINSILNSKNVVNNLSTKQFLELQNYTNDYLNTKVNAKIEIDKPKTNKSFKEQVKQQKLIEEQKKAEQLKQHQKSKTRITVLRPDISDTSKNQIASLIKSAESSVGIKNPSSVVVGSSSKEVVPYEIAKSKGNRLNFNLKGFSLFENAAYNSKIHGISNTIQELDEGVKNKKISLSEANKIKSTLQDNTVSHKLNQLGTNDQVKQFNRPEYQKLFKEFLKKSFNKYMKVIPVAGPLFMLKDMKKQYEQIQSGEHPMFPSAEKLSTQVYKRGGKVKPKPYAMGGKVYSNSVRKPKFK